MESETTKNDEVEIEVEEEEGEILEEEEEPKTLVDKLIKIKKPPKKRDRTNRRSPSGYINKRNEVLNNYVNDYLQKNPAKVPQCEKCTVLTEDIEKLKKQIQKLKLKSKSAGNIPIATPKLS